MDLNYIPSYSIAHKPYEEIVLEFEKLALLDLLPEEIEPERKSKDIEDIRADFLCKNINISFFRVDLEDKERFKALVKKALQYIPSAEEKILHDLCFSSHSIRTIAKELGISKNSVLNRKRRALTRIFYILGFLVRDLEVPKALRRARLDLSFLGDLEMSSRFISL